MNAKLEAASVRKAAIEYRLGGYRVRDPKSFIDERKPGLLAAIKNALKKRTVWEAVAITAGSNNIEYFRTLRKKAKASVRAGYQFLVMVMLEKPNEHGSYLHSFGFDMEFTRRSLRLI